MSFRDDLRTVVAEIRSIPNEFGVRPYSVAVRVNEWSGDERGDGDQTSTKTSTTTAITEANGAPPKVRWLTDEQLALAGVEHGAELIEVGPITPGNTLHATITQTPTNGTVEWIVTGPRYPSGAIFTMKELKDHRGYQFRVVLQKSSD